MNGVKKLSKKTVGWKDIIVPITEKPEGYSTIGEIAKTTNISESALRKVLLQGVREGRIKRIRCKGSKGQQVWCYKD